MKVGVALADVLAGKDAAIAVLSALVARSRAHGTAPPATPLGVTDRRLSVSLLHSATSALVNVAQNALVSGRAPQRWGNAHPNLVPYELFSAADRPIVIAVGSDAQFAACVRVLGLAALAADETLVTNAGRLAQRERVVNAISARIGTDVAAHWLARLQEAGVPCGVVKPVLEALEAVDGSALTGVSPQLPGAVRLAPPRLDEHGEIVRATGWGAFDRLRQTPATSPR
jgi:crotonobetainyl-CoA:carnitine CoA-transferase CaiB-like acyl-CoA transferase